MKKVKDQSITENIDEEFKNEILQEDKKTTKIILSVILIIIVCIGILAIPFGKTISKKINNIKESIEEKANQNISPSDNENDSFRKQDDETTSLNSNIEDTSQLEQDILNLYQKIYITEENLYNNNTYSLETMSTYDIVASAIRLIDQNYIVSACDTTKTRQDVTFEYINNTLNNYLLNKSIDINTIKSLNTNSSYLDAEYEVANIGIKQNGDAIQLYGPCGAVYNEEEYTTKKVEKIEVQEEYVYLYEKHAFVKKSPTFYEDDILNYYKTYNRDGEIVESISSSTQTEPNWSLYNTYKYTFRKHDNGYYFEKVELI